MAYLPVRLEWWQECLIEVGFVALVVVINIAGVDFLSQLSIAILAVVLLPFLIEAVAVPSEGYFEPEKLLDHKHFDKVEWALFISVLIWNLDGYDIMGTVDKCT